MATGLWSRRPLSWFAAFHSFSPPAPGLVITSSFCLETVSSRWYCLLLRPCLPSKLFSVLPSAAATSPCLHHAEGEAAGGDKIVAGVVILPTAAFRQKRNGTKKKNIILALKTTDVLNMSEGAGQWPESCCKIIIFQVALLNGCSGQIIVHRSATDVKFNLKNLLYSARVNVFSWLFSCATFCGKLVHWNNSS